MPGSFSDFTGNIWNASDVLRWIKQNVPCFAGVIPAQWTQAVYAEAQRRNINRIVVQTALALAPTQGYRFDLTDPSVARMSATDKLAAAMSRAVSYLPADLKAFGAQLTSRESLMIMAGTFVAWAGSHAVGIGEIVDFLLLVVGVVCVGFSIFSGASELIDFIHGAIAASTEADLDDAARHFARACVLLGISFIQALLLRKPMRALKPRPGGPRWSFRNPLPGGRPRFKLSDPLPPPGTKPTINYAPYLDGGRSGMTDKFGNIWISRAYSAAEQAKALSHELVHRFFTPLAQTLRKVRVELAIDMYERSAFLQYLEEMLCEGWAQLTNNGILGPAMALKGLVFPALYGYITVSEILVEGNLIGTIVLAGKRVYVVATLGEPPAEMQ